MSTYFSRHLWFAHVDVADIWTRFEGGNGVGSMHSAFLVCLHYSELWVICMLRVTIWKGLVLLGFCGKTFYLIDAESNALRDGKGGKKKRIVLLGYKFLDCVESGLVLGFTEICVLLSIIFFFCCNLFIIYLDMFWRCMRNLQDRKVCM